MYVYKLLIGLHRKIKWIQAKHIPKQQNSELMQIFARECASVILLRVTAIQREREWGTSGPASAQEASAVKRTTESAGSSSEVGTTVVILRQKLSAPATSKP